MLSQKMRKLQEEVVCIRDIFEEGKKLAAIYGAENIFNFTIGNPSVDPPKEVIEAYKKYAALQPYQSVHGYPSNVGFPEVRQRIAEYLNEQYGTNYDYTGIFMTVGAGTGITSICNMILDPDDEVITFSPFFWEYKSYVGNFRGKLVTARCNMQTLQPDPVTFEAAFSPRTKLVLMCSPNNPTGAVYTEESLNAIAAIMEKKQKEYGHPIYLISDEPYRLLSYDKPVPYTAKYYRNTLSVYSYSKTLSIPGDRIGYVAALPTVDDYEDIQLGMNGSIRWIGLVNAPSLQQKILLDCCDMCVDTNIYKKTRDILYHGLTDIGYNVIYPDGAFYMFMQALEEDDIAFCEKAKEEKLLFAPGTAFEGPGWVRIAYPVPPEMAERSLPAFERLYKKYRG